MVKVMFFVYCESVETQMVQSGMPRMNIINPMLIMTPPYIPGVYSFSILLGLQGFDVKKNNTLRLILKNPLGSTVVDSNIINLPATDEGSATLPKEYRGMQMNMDFRNTVLEVEGDYFTEVILNGEQIGSYGISVLKAGENHGSHI